MRKYALAVLFVLAVLVSCGQQPEEEAVDQENGNGEEIVQSEEYVLPEADIYLTVSDSIGVELGDSNYVFGQIAGVDMTAGGNIAVLDLQKCCVNLYSPAGEFLQRIGRNGSGPGEFQLPAGMTFFPEFATTFEGETLPDSLIPSFVVCDAMGGKLVYFDANLEYMMDVQGFFPSPPAVITGVDNRAIVGMKPIFLQNEEGMFMGFTIARWEMGETEPSIVYFESMSPFDPSDLSSMQGDIVSYGANDEGMVLTASLSTDTYEYTLWDPQGGEVFTYLDEGYERVPKTQEEIDLEKELVNNRMIQQGMPPDMANWEPNPYRSAIGGLWFDGMNRIWVTRGYTRTPAFDVYDMEGNHLFSAALDAGERAMTWGMVIKGDKFMAFDADPEFYPLLYVGDLPGFDDDKEEEEGV